MQAFKPEKHPSMSKWNEYLRTEEVALDATYHPSTISVGETTLQA